MQSPLAENAGFFLPSIPRWIKCYGSSDESTRVLVRARDDPVHNWIRHALRPGRGPSSSNDLRARRLHTPRMKYRPGAGRLFAAKLASSGCLNRTSRPSERSSSSSCLMRVRNSEGSSLQVGTTTRAIAPSIWLRLYDITQQALMPSGCSYCEHDGPHRKGSHESDWTDA
jgi:hypothetical protein